VTVARRLASSYAGPLVVLLAAIVGAVLFGWAVLGMPHTDLIDLIVFLTASGSGSILVGYALILAAPRIGLGGVRPRLMIAHLVVLAIAFANIVVTAWLMFISPHDLTLLGLLLAFSAVVAVAFAALTAEQVLRAVRGLAAAAREVAGGRLGVRVASAGPDELAALARDFNVMSERLEESDRMRREMEEARRHLFAAISHDLRTPLASIRAMVEAIDDGVVSDAETTRRYVHTVLGEVQRLSGLIDDLFELSRLDAGVLALQIEPGSLHDLVSDTLEALHAQATEKGLHLRGEVDEALPPVLMDTARVQRVLFNLVQNAIRHTPTDGTILLKAEEEPDAVRVDVLDSGEGVAPDDLPHIFERFYRGEKSRVRGQGGTGLGLAIAQGLVEAHGGRIWAQSAPGHGAQFSFVLPKEPALAARCEADVTSYRSCIRG
jgi:signal transduction histidine kinase